MADLIKATDSLNQGREKLNSIAKEMNEKDVVSAPEIIEARINTDGTVIYDTLKDRLDIEHQEITSNLENVSAKIAGNTQRIKDIAINVKDFGVVGDGITDDTEKIQDLLDTIKPIGGTLYFPEGVYMINLNKGIVDNWGVKIEGSNIYLLGDRALFKRIGDISVESNAYPHIFIGTPDSNYETDRVRNIIIDGISFEGQDKRHNVSGNTIPDNRYSIIFRNVNGLTVKNCIFTKVDSGAIYPKQVGYQDCTVKNYNLLVENCKFYGVPHSHDGRAFIHAVVLSGIDNAKVINNYFEWCDDGVAGVTTYEENNQHESDLWVHSTLGPVRRGGRDWTITNNTFINNSEHGIYINGVSVIINGNIVRCDEEICRGDIKIRSKNVVVKGNTIITNGGCILISSNSSDISITGNNLTTNTSTISCIGIDAVGIKTFIDNRGHLQKYLPISNIIISDNVIQSFITSGDNVGMRIYSDTSSLPEYPNGTINNVIIRGNTFKGFETSINFINNNARGIIIDSNVFMGIDFDRSGFNISTIVPSKICFNSHKASSTLWNTIISNNIIDGFQNLLGERNNEGLQIYNPNMIGNRLRYIKTIQSSSYRGFDLLSMFTGNTGTYVLDNGWFSSYTLNNAIHNGISQGSSQQSRLSVVSPSDIRLYTDDVGGYAQLAGS